MNGQLVQTYGAAASIYVNGRGVPGLTLFTEKDAEQPQFARSGLTLPAMQNGYSNGASTDEYR